MIKPTYINGVAYIKANIIMLPNNGKAGIGSIYKCIKIDPCIEDIIGELYINVNCNVNKSNDRFQAQHLYFVTNEATCNGYWCINKNRDTLYQPNHLGDTSNWNKVIVSTDKSLNLPEPSMEFIQKYIDAHNEGIPITEVLIECEEYATVKEGTGWIYGGHRLKVESVHLEKSYLEPEYGRHLKLSLIGTNFTVNRLHKYTIIWEKDLIVEQVIKVDEDNTVKIVKHKTVSHANMEKALEELVSILNAHGIRKHTCINNSGYSQIERDIVDVIIRSDAAKEYNKD